MPGNGRFTRSPGLVPPGSVTPGLVLPGNGLVPPGKGLLMLGKLFDPPGKVPGRVMGFKLPGDGRLGRAEPRFPPPGNVGLLVGKLGFAATPG